MAAATRGVTLEATQAAMAAATQAATLEARQVAMAAAMAAAAVEATLAAMPTRARATVSALLDLYGLSHELRIRVHAPAAAL